MFFSYANFQRSQMRYCYHLHWDTLFQEYIWSRSINSRVGLYMYPDKTLPIVNQTLHNLSFSLQPFCKLVFPQAHCSSKRKLGCSVRVDYMTLNENGWFNLSRTCHVASSWITWCDVISVSSYSREPIKALIFLYIWQEPMVSAVAEQQNR